MPFYIHIHVIFFISMYTCSYSCYIFIFMLFYIHIHGIFFIFMYLYSHSCYIFYIHIHVIFFIFMFMLSVSHIHDLILVFMVCLFIFTVCLFIFMVAYSYSWLLIHDYGFDVQGLQKKSFYLF